jgi:phenylalanyl-tRNA synthetase beta subunit
MTPLALLGLGEQVLELNITPDRGYCFSMRGIAREYWHSQGSPAGAFRDPGVVPTNPPANLDGYAVHLTDAAPIDGAVGCDRYVARIVRGIDPTASSPAWMRTRLTQAGMRPISLAVDVTNYVMLLVGQPLHAFDLDTLSGSIKVRRARAGERLTTLDGVDRELHAAGPAHHRRRPAAVGPRRGHGWRDLRSHAHDDEHPHRGGPLRPGDDRPDLPPAPPRQRGVQALRARRRSAGR